jgi:serine/threonine-protein kinase RsbT
MSEQEGEARLLTSLDVVRVRQRVRQLSAAAGFSLVKQIKLMTATSELARNAVKYGVGGVARWRRIGTTRPGIRVIIEDQGPGIGDSDLALSDGWSTGGGLGLGLPGARRLVDEFTFTSTVGIGTRVEIVMWR